MPSAGLPGSAEREIEARRVPKIILAVVPLGPQVFEPGQVVIQSDRPQAEMFIDLNIQAAARRHGESGLS